MHWTAVNRVGRSLLAVVLAGGTCVPALAQSSSEKAASGLSSLPRDAQGPISAALGKDDSRYWIRRSGAGYRGENSGQALVAEFTREGAEVQSQNLHWRLETRAYGYGKALYSLQAVTPTANADRVEYRRDGVTEWYENGPLGLEQGFTLAYRPALSNGKPLTLELGISGDLLAAMEPGSRGLELRRRDGKAVLRYTGLEARDATGRALRSWLELQGERLLVRVEDKEARYPIAVDPWLEQAEITASDGAADDSFGDSVAISGNTIVVGAPHHKVGSNYSQGAAYIFVESGGTWMQQAELIASDGVAGDQFGSAVAISGSTVVVGAPGHSPEAAYVFVESAGTWMQQAELTASDGLSGDQFGSSVAISGTLVLVGASSHPHTPGFGAGTPGPGAAYVFAQSGGTWSQQAELTVSGAVSGDGVGWSVAVSGSTAVIGAPFHKVGSNQGQGAAYVFIASGATWSQQAELTASDGMANDQLGVSVAISGSTAVVGAATHQVGSNYEQGAAYVFVETGVTWTQQAELTASDGVALDEFGSSVAVSSSTVVVGAPGYEYYPTDLPGKAYVFGGSSGTWTQQAELKALDGAAMDEFGSSVAISGDNAVVGADRHPASSYENFGPGAAYVFSSAAFPPPVRAVSVNPNSGSGQSQAFTAVYSDLAGASDLSDVRMLINSAESISHACYVRYAAAAKELELLNDAGTAWSAGLTAGGSGSVSNSQCTLSAAGSSVSASGDTLSVVFDISFSDFAGSKNIWLYAANYFNQSTGLDLLGSFTAEGSTVPVNVSVSPQNGSGSAQAFTAVYSDSNGASELSDVRMLINVDERGIDACYVRYVAATGQLELANDAGTAWSAGLTPGGSGSVSNGQCTLLAAGSSVTASGDTLTVVFDISFADFTGTKKIWLLAEDNLNQTTGPTLVGTFAAEGTTVPVNVSVSPQNGSGAAQAFTAVYSDSNGASDFSEVRMLINSVESVIRGCYVRYVVATRQLELLNDMGNAWSAGTTLGGSGSLSNSQCTLSAAGSSVSASGNTMSVVFDISFTDFTGAKKIWLFSADDLNQTTGLALLGTFAAEGTRVPVDVSVSPQNGSGSVQPFTAVYSDSNGASDFSEVRMLINGVESVTRACYVRYLVATGELELLNDVGNAWSAGIALGGSGSLSNSQCTLSAAGSSVTASGDTLSVVFDVSFTDFAGAKSIWLFSADNLNQTTGLHLLGGYTVVPPPAGLNFGGSRAR